MILLIFTLFCYQDPVNTMAPVAEGTPFSQVNNQALRLELVELKARIDSLEMMKTIFAGISIGLLLAASTFFFKIKNWTAKQFEDRIGETLNKRIDLIAGHLDILDRDQRYMREKKILILAKTVNPESAQILLKMGFHKVTKKLFPAELSEESFRQLKEEEFDLVILEDLSSVQYKAYGDRSQVKYPICYTKERQSEEILKRYQLSNVPFTLFSRVFEVLRFSEYFDTDG